MSAAGEAADQPLPLRYVPFSSAVEPGFWHRLSRLKLDVLRLDEQPLPVAGSFSSFRAAAAAGHTLPPLLSVDYTAFDSVDPTSAPAGDKSHMPPSSTALEVTVPGQLLNKNTLEAFRSCDKAELLRFEAERMWRSIVDGTVLREPWCLNGFLLLTYADLKRHDFLYWFCFPALKFPASVLQTSSASTLQQYLASGQCAASLEEVAAAAARRHEAAFLLRLTPAPSALPLTELPVSDSVGDDLLLVFRDPSCDPEHPGWPLRNLLAAYWHHRGHRCPAVRVLCLRETTRDGRRSLGDSLILSLRLSHIDGSTDAAPAATGWERNERANMGPRRVNLSASLDPKLLAAGAVDLNLRLMRWRLVPELDLDRMARARCLLLGAGTLGCAVARALLGWGVRTITFVDSGVVSYSNPARQSLFTFEDSVRRRPKAAAAADRLRDVFPGVVSEGVQLSIPMPGHPVSPALRPQVTSDLSQLTRLVTSHDVIFLLTDSRESRWLPTLLGAAHRKLVINAALGFDSYLVMRHGLREPSSPATAAACAADAAGDSGAALATGASDGAAAAVSADPRRLIPGSQLGCYFCNDVVAPGNSLQDRTLDQQCTVTRPGVSLVAAGLAVELMAATLQHPQRAGAPVSGQYDDQESCAGPLGCVPHSIRGFVAQTQQFSPATSAFARCTACSHTVLRLYREQGDDFLMQVFNKSSHLEDVTGLTELHQLTEQTQLWELSDEEGDDF